MKTALLLFALLLSTSLAAQEPRGVTPIPHSAFRTPHTTRAVVVGISNYLNIPDLQYANRDAEAFAGWLRSEAGGNVPEQQIELLLDTAATMGRVTMALDWLISESKEGDRAIIYFSGHGDIEQKMFGQPGYLLCYDAPQVVYYSGGTLSVSILQEIVTTLTLVRKAQVVMITDACRAGKLAGSTIGGPQLTTAALQERFGNAVRIMSCQPNEYSLESRQWGGGRGVFSYHLVEGLYGLADQNADLMINLKEIGRYLEDHVPKEADPQVQNPVVLGDREMKLAVVSAPLLATRKAMHEKEQSGFYSGDMRAMVSLTATIADSSVQEIYQAFLSAVSARWLMNAPAGKLSANECYDILLRDSSISSMHSYIKRHFVAALVDESQVVTNKLLVTDPFVVSDVISRPFVFDHIHTYLARAIELLGARHFLYKQLKAKQYYFEAKTYRQENYPNWPVDTLVSRTALKLEEALRYDSNAAYIHVELGFLLYYKLFRQDKALLHAKKALDLSPNWAYAQNLAGNCYRNINSTQAVYHLKRAIELDSTFLISYSGLALQYQLLNNREEQVYYQNQFIEKAKALIALNPEKATVTYRILLAAELWRLGRLEEAEKFLLQAETLSKGQDFGVYQYLGVVYQDLNRYEDALIAAKKQLELAPYNPEGYLQMAICYTKMNQPLQTVKVLEKAFSSIESLNTDPNYSWLRKMLADGYQKLGREEAAKIQFQKILELIPNPSTPLDFNMIGRAWLGLGDLVAFHKTITEGLDKFPGDPMMYYQVACLYSLAEQDDKALESLELAIKAGMEDFSLISTDTDLEFIRDKPGFKALMKKYIPEQVKD